MPPFSFNIGKYCDEGFGFFPKLLSMVKNTEENKNENKTVQSRIEEIA